MTHCLIMLDLPLNPFLDFSEIKEGEYILEVEDFDNDYKKRVRIIDD